MINEIDHIIQSVNDTLSGIELKNIEKFKAPIGPVFFIVGVPRSGTTVLLQTIINYYKVGYINNFIAKFWKAPVVGALLYQSMGAHSMDQSYKSDSGFTKGVEGPHEFGYFWRRFFNYEEAHQIERKKYNLIDHELLNKEIAGLESVLSKPMIFKNPPALSLNIEYIYKYIPNSYFIYMKRDPYFIAQSIYLKRKEIFNDIKKWYSIKPKEFQKLKSESPYEQIAGQVYFSTVKIEEDLSFLPDERKITISYENFCKKPIHWINTCSNLSRLLDPDKKLAADDLRFDNKNKISLSQETWDLLVKEVDKLYNS